MAARGRSAQKVGEALFALIQSEAPSFAIFFEKIQEIYTKLSLNYETASKEQSRAVEDLKDILVRTPVFQRISAERDIAKRNYDIAHKKYREAKILSQNHAAQETMMAFRNCRIERANSASILIEKTEVFLKYRIRFTRFVQNRSQSAWLTYGRSIVRASLVESELMGQLADLCKKLRENVENPHLILKTVEQAATDLRITEGEGPALPFESMEEEE
jgi:hypothetical protein